MKKTKILITAVALIIYNYLFWHEKLGVNLLLFTSLLMFIVVYLKRENFNHLHIKLLALTTLVTGMLAVINNSGVSKFTHVISFLLLTGCIHVTDLRVFYNILAGACLNYFATPFTAFGNASQATQHIKPMRKFFYWVRILLLPLLIFMLFFIIYNAANAQFENLFSGFFSEIQKAISTLLQYISFAHTIFLVLGFILITGTLQNKYFGFLLSNEMSFKDFITRENMRKAVSSRNISGGFPINGLRKEYRSGVILLTALNLILLTLNIIDIKLLWFGFYPGDQFNMKAFVHEGTFLLIISIVLSMILVLYFFRRSQNFYSKNRSLKVLSYVWIVQNIILLISVCIRNQQYIFYNGLAYKRIGLYAFLLLTLIGLITLIIKIKELKSFFYLLRVNTWAAYLIFILLSVFNWDMIIARTNLANENGSGIDIDFYLELSPQTYPLISQNLDKIEKQISQHHLTGVRWTSCNNITEFKEILARKKGYFLVTYQQYSWPSWNYSDYAAITNLSLNTTELSLSNGAQK